MAGGRIPSRRRGAVTGRPGVLKELRAAGSHPAAAEADGNRTRRGTFAPPMVLKTTEPTRRSFASQNRERTNDWVLRDEAHRPWSARPGGDDLAGELVPQLCPRLGPQDQHDEILVRDHDQVLSEKTLCRVRSGSEPAET